MNSFLELLSQILRQFVDLMPHVHPRPATTEWSLVDSAIFGVKLVRRPVVYWPILDHVETWDRTIIPQDTEVQTITLSCGAVVSVNAAYEYRVTDPVKCRAKWGDNCYVNMNVRVRAEIAVALSECDLSAVGEFDLSKARDAVSREFSTGGAELVSLVIEELSACESTRHWGIAIGG